MINMNNNFKKSNDILKEINNLQRQVKIKNAYLQLIIDLAFDYDGYEKAEDLKELIDELVAYAVLAIKNDDKEVIYESGHDQTQSNILMEPLDI